MAEGTEYKGDETVNKTDAFQPMTSFSNSIEVGFYRFKQVLEDKARNNYKEVVFVGRFYPSSKTCHKCGYMNKELTLNDREWTCPVCGEHHDRDLNAAINILMEGERIIGVRSTEFTLVEKPTVDDRTLCS